MISRRALLQIAASQLVTKSVGLCQPDHCERQVQSIAQLRSLDPGNGTVVLSAEGRAGVFRWVRGNFTKHVDGDPLAGRFIASRHAAPSSGVWVRAGRNLTPEMFGAHPGQTDHHDVLAAAFAQIGAGISLVLDGSYQTSRAVFIGQRSNFQVSGRGRITSLAGAPVAYGYGVLYFSECSDFELTGLTFDGNREARDPKEEPAHTVTFQSCRRFKVREVSSLNSVCDGFHLFSALPDQVESHCHDFEFDNCIADNCARQGCSVIEGHHGIFRGGSFSRSNGIAPEAGIDLESDPGAPVASISDIELENVVFAKNSGFGLLVSTVSRPQGIVATGCQFIENRKGAISWGAVSGQIIAPLVDGFTASAERGAIDVPGGDGWRNASGTLISSPKFRRVSSARAANALVYVHSEAYGPVAITGLESSECGSIVGLHRDGSSFSKATVRASLGKIDGALGVSGKDCAVRDNRIEAFFGSVITSTGQGTIITGNHLVEPRLNNNNGAIRVMGSGAIIENNVLEASNGDTGIMVTQEARSIRGNRAVGFVRALSRNAGQ